MDSEGYGPDYTGAKTVRMSNDAFFYLKYGEAPIDDGNIAEAEEIRSMFPQGFEIREGHRPVPGSGTVEVTIMPYTACEPEYDMYSELARGYTHQIRFTNGGNSVRLWSYKEKTGERTYKGEFDLKMDTSRRVYFTTGDYRNGKGCLFWLKYYKEKHPGAADRMSRDLPLGPFK